MAADSKTLDGNMKTSDLIEENFSVKEEIVFGSDQDSDNALHSVLICNSQTFCQRDFINQSQTSDIGKIESHERESVVGACGQNIKVEPFDTVDEYSFACGQNIKVQPFDTVENSFVCGQNIKVEPFDTVNKNSFAVKPCYVKLTKISMIPHNVNLVDINDDSQTKQEKRNCSFIKNREKEQRKQHRGEKKSGNTKRNSKKSIDVDQLFNKFMKWMHNHQCLVCKEVFDNVEDFKHHLYNTDHCKKMFTYKSKGTTFWCCKPCDFTVTNANKHRFYEHLIIVYQHGNLGHVNVLKTNPHIIQQTEAPFEDDPIDKYLVGKSDSYKEANQTLDETGAQDELDRQVTEQTKSKGVIKNSKEQDINDLRGTASSLLSSEESTTCLIKEEMASKLPRIQDTTNIYESGGWFCTICQKSVAEVRRSMALRHLKIHQCKDEIPDVNLFDKQDLYDAEFESKTTFSNVCKNDADMVKPEDEHDSSDKQAQLKENVLGKKSRRKRKLYVEQHNDITSDDLTCSEEEIENLEDGVLWVPNRQRKKVKATVERKNVMKNVQSEAERLFYEYMYWAYPMRCLICRNIYHDRSEFQQHVVNVKHCIDYYSVTKNGIKYLQCPPCGRIYKRRFITSFMNHLIRRGKHGQMGCVNVCKDNMEKSIKRKMNGMDDDKEKYSTSKIQEAETCFPDSKQSDDDAYLSSEEGQRNSDKYSISHLNFTEMKDKPIRGGWFCTICNDVIPHWQKFNAILHIKEMHVTETDFKCRICSKILSSKKNLEKHMECHPENESHQCSICGKKFQRLKILYGHTAAVHKMRKSGPVEKKYICKICGKLFYRKELKDAHEKVHSAVKDFICEYCGLCFINKAPLREHIHKKHVASEKYKQKHEEKRNCFVVCKKCGKLIRLTNIIQHEMLHDERKFSCTICNKKFVHPHHLKNHEVVHTGIRKFTCHLCQYTFTLKHHLDSHLKTQHNIITKKKCKYSDN